MRSRIAPDDPFRASARRPWLPADMTTPPALDGGDTAHAVFRPRHMTPAELEQGYAWLYRTLFSHASI